MLRTIIGFLVAPVVGVTLAILVVFGRDVHSVLWAYLTVGSAVAYSSTLLFGVPSYLLMKRFTKLACWQIALAGGLCGLPYWLISGYPYTSAYFQKQGLTNLALFVAAGVIAGLVFWFITRGPAPSNSTIERDARKSSTRPSM